MGHTFAAGKLLEGDAGAVRQVAAGIQVVGHGLAAGGIPVGLVLLPLTGLAVVGAGGGGAQGGAVVPVDKGTAQGGFVLQGI